MEPDRAVTEPSSCLTQAPTSRGTHRPPQTGTYKVLQTRSICVIGAKPSCPSTARPDCQAAGISPTDHHSPHVPGAATPHRTTAKLLDWLSIPTGRPPGLPALYRFNPVPPTPPLGLPHLRPTFQSGAWVVRLRFDLKTCHHPSKYRPTRGCAIAAAGSRYRPSSVATDQRRKNPPMVQVQIEHHRRAERTSR